MDQWMVKNKGMESTSAVAFPLSKAKYRNFHEKRNIYVWSFWPEMIVMTSLEYATVYKTKQCKSPFQRASRLRIGTKARRRQQSRYMNERMFALTET